jgi:hypothetical protein
VREHVKKSNWIKKTKQPRELHLAEINKIPPLQQTPKNAECSSAVINPVVGSTEKVKQVND